ncbi:MAG: Crp/Fnr family transcriptional regulator [Curvibacter sp.]|jgi:CRP/FNR family cyclic AMP-dependent transcriptional regulator|nr:Crp/Fnr family transcriptional regulator [Curvibacter sp.]
MSMLTNQDLLRRVPLFSMLSDEHLQSLAAAVVKRRVKRGERVVQQGEKSDALSIILSGRARVLMTNSGNGREVILATLQSGDYFGEMSLIDNDVHSASVEAETQTDVLELGRSEFLRSLTECDPMAYGIMRGLVQRLRHADRKIGSLALMSVYGRVANVLLDTAEAAPAGDMIIRERLSRQDLAKMVGASREMVSRVMKDFEEQGFVTPLEGGAMHVKERRSRPR